MMQHQVPVTGSPETLHFSEGTPVWLILVVNVLAWRRDSENADTEWMLRRGEENNSDISEEVCEPHGE